MEVEEQIKKLREYYGVDNDNQLSIALGLKDNSSIPQWRKNQRVPAKHLLKISNNTKKDKAIKKQSNSTYQDDNLDGYWIKKVNSKVGAGKSIDITGVELEIVKDKVFIPSSFFKTIKNQNNLRMIQVDGYSMVPDLLPDSYVIYEEGVEFIGDGFYIINFDGLLMVKTIQKRPNGDLLIKSSNPAYESFLLNQDSEMCCYIVGKVLRCIV
ncbi:transcriptional regulator [Campylobacter hyointestinalis subsp. hyointestinalis]|uniref:Transcriptional regulator n=1 Tax=Campylobacter hyointestinalis subsp. hyointestinalis TaxID=91352 RepID=A0A0S4RT15_CAMHY|nr:S24 family peptidase [Campylobacter hyointestinalis]CUU76938.1 transcriptional regulator [Campylobacter hyointestinalis subsp. hyointestinalis]CUU90775.1 transcriptional regulator [Campylobacter hyointestinalis subsp. hyointestinalis]